MSDGPTTGRDRRLELVEVIHRVRNRWRMRLAMRGAVVVVAGTVLTLLHSAAFQRNRDFRVPAPRAGRVCRPRWLGTGPSDAAPRQRFAGRDVPRRV